MPRVTDELQLYVSKYVVLLPQIETVVLVTMK